MKIFSILSNYLRDKFQDEVKDTVSELVLGAIDLFVLWQLTVFAIGVAVLYGKRTGPIATIFYMLYAVIAIVIAFVFTRIGG